MCVSVRVYLCPSSVLPRCCYCSKCPPNFAPATGASAISFEVQSTGKAYTFNVQYTGNAAYTLLFYPSNTPGEAKLLSIFTGEVGSKTTAPPHHHHMWVPIVVALAVTAVVMSAAGIWYYIRRGRNAYQPI